ncbi:unnamed protein product, partial [Adineta steineri]
IVVMSSLRRSPLTSIENIDTPLNAEEIELREVNEPLLPTNEETLPPTEQNNEEIDETTPFQVNINDDNRESQVEFRPSTPQNESEFRQRHRRSVCI